MPSTYPTNDDQRERKTLHAPWWSNKFTTDGKPNSPEVAEEDGGIPVERCVVFARRLHKDDVAVNRRAYGTMEIKAGQKLDTSLFVKSPDYLIQQMVTELTDAEGQPAPMLAIVGKRPMLTENFISGMDELDANFILRELEKLKEEPVPVTEKDEQEAAARNARRTSMLQAGLHPHQMPPQYQDDVTPEVVAQDYFRPNREEDF